jgi:hypothetical protein
MWTIHSQGQPMEALTDTNEVKLGPGTDGFIRGDGETVLLIKNSEGITRSLVYVSADGTASAVRV